MIEFIDKSSENEGTPLNRENMMAIQGYVSSNVVFIRDENNNIIGVQEIYPTGIKTTVRNGNKITETFEGEKTIVKTTTLLANGDIEGVIS